MPATYKFEYSEDNVYGHAVHLVRQFGSTRGVHLDLGCGFGPLAEPLRALGLTYVGGDVDPDALADLQGRGFEVHSLDLGDHRDLLSRLREVIGARPLASISILDTLEHLTNDVAVLSALHGLAEGTSIPLIVSVPNVSHHDLALKLLMGSWSYTETGLLDRTHVIHHTERLLEAMARTTGWHEIGRGDVFAEESDQHFPKHSVLLSPTSTLNAFLRKVRECSDDNARVVQMVRAYLPGPLHPTPIVAHREAPSQPFLSVIVRTQGRRPATLRDALLSLTGQSCEDFEILVVAHRVNRDQQICVERQTEELPPSVRHRTRLIRVDHGGRAAPLNAGFREARGEYVAVLDDDDIVFGHWVESFKTAAASWSGRVLRAIAVEQEIDPVTWSDTASGFRTVGGPRMTYPGEYNIFAHLTQNFSPLMCLAFPSSLFHELGFRFDDRLTTCEDWDFEMRSVLTCGVASIPEITAIYRRWKGGNCSYTLHSPSEWIDNENSIISRLDAQPHVFPPGTVREIRAQRASVRKLEANVRSLETELADLRTRLASPPLRHRLVDRLNATVKRLPIVHSLLKAPFLRD